MKDKTMLDTGIGSEKEIELMSTLRGGAQVLIAIYDKRPLSQIAAEHEGCTVMTKHSERQPNIKEVFEGYTELVSIQRSAPGEMVRIVLAKA